MSEHKTPEQIVREVFDTRWPEEDNPRNLMILAIELDRAQREEALKRKFGSYRGDRVEILSRVENGIFSTYRIQTRVNGAFHVYCDEVSQIEEGS